MILPAQNSRLRGQTSLEYLLLLAVVAVVVIVGFSKGSLIDQVHNAAQGYYNSVTRVIMGENPKPINGGWCPVTCPYSGGKPGSIGPTNIYGACECPAPAFGGTFCPAVGGITGCGAGQTCKGYEVSCGGQSHDPTCPPGQVYDRTTQQCVCSPTTPCGSSTCGSDSCGNSCGNCPSGQTCSTTDGTPGTCRCQPSCDGQPCGASDGCGGTCGGACQASGCGYSGTNYFGVSGNQASQSCAGTYPPDETYGVSCQNGVITGWCAPTSTNGRGLVNTVDCQGCNWEGTYVFPYDAFGSPLNLFVTCHNGQVTGVCDSFSDPNLGPSSNQYPPGFYPDKYYCGSPSNVYYCDFSGSTLDFLDCGPGNDSFLTCNNNQLTFFNNSNMINGVCGATANTCKTGTPGNITSTGWTCNGSNGGTTASCTTNACVPLTSCPAGDNCGSISDHCRGTVNCGSCPDGQSCSNNVCITNTCPSPQVLFNGACCTPATTCPAGDKCDSVSDNCGGTVNCGSCPAGQSCSNHECITNTCPSPQVLYNGSCCTPLTSCPAGDKCDTVSDNCGGTISCGTCTAPQTCGGSGIPNVCGCTATTCADLGFNCGSNIPDGCGGKLNCGACTSPQTCGGGGTADICGCTPTTCAIQGKNCGTMSDRCGNTLDCGSCPGTEQCNNGVCSLPVSVACGGTAGTCTPVDATAGTVTTSHGTNSWTCSLGGVTVQCSTTGSNDVCGAIKGKCDPGYTRSGGITHSGGCYSWECDAANAPPCCTTIVKCCLPG